MKILVTGGTGSLGKCFTELAVEEGISIRIASRNQPEDQKAEWCYVDMETGEGIKEAVRGIDLVFHAATNPVKRYEQVDFKGTKQLLQACKEEKVKHFVYPSIVGIDKIPMKYYACKARVETLIKESGMPYTIVRATQFHNLIERLFLLFAKLPVIMLPKKMKFQTIAVEEVAAVFLEICKGEAQGSLADIAGPEVLTVKEMYDIWLKTAPMKKKFISIPLPIPVVRGFVKGYNTSEERKIGQTTWEAWLQKVNS